MTPFASLVVLSYKRPDLLDESLESLLKSAGRTPYEIIVVDDGSRDACWPLLQQLVRRQLISSLVINAGDNMGVGVGMNRGFALARGEWVVKLDADLLYTPGWLDEGVKLLANPQVAVAGFFDYRHYTADDTRFNRIGEIRNEAGELIGYEVDDFVSSSFMLRRADWLRFGVQDGIWRGFEEGSAAFAEDVAWKKKMQAAGFKLAITATDWQTNIGFGLGLSTVVTPDAAGQPQVTPVHGPLVFNQGH